MISRTLTVLITLLLLPLSAAQAGLVTFAYQGEIDSIVTAGVPPEGFEPLLGETLRVQFTFDTDTPADWVAGIEARPGFGFIGQYVGAVKSASVTVGPPDSPLLECSSNSPFGSIGVGLNQADYFIFIDSIGGLLRSTNDPTILLPCLAFLAGFSVPGPPLDPEKLPGIPPVPGAFSEMMLDFAENEFAPIVHLQAHDVRVVPEPGTITLFGVSGLWLTVRSKRRRRLAASPHITR
jgi:hypothetical protein